MVNIIPILDTIKNECQCYNILQDKLKELYYDCNNDCTVCDNSLSSLTQDDTDCLKLLLYYLSFCIFCMCVSPKIWCYKEINTWQLVLLCWYTECIQLNHASWIFIYKQYWDKRNKPWYCTGFCVITFFNVMRSQVHMVQRYPKNWKNLDRYWPGNVIQPFIISHNVVLV